MLEHYEKIPKIQDADLRDKIVLVRVDHNVVKDDIIKDPFRIDQTFGTLFNILSKGGKLILMTHVGRPRDKKTGKIDMSPKYSIQTVVEYLERKLFTKFIVPDFKEDYEKGGYVGIDTGINLLIKKLRAGKIDGIYLPNTRWFIGEEQSGLDAEKFGEQLAGLADVYVNDAFGSWQSHTSTLRVTENLPSYSGYLMQKEMLNLERVLHPKKPMLAVIAGSKFDTKIGPLRSLLQKVDHLILGGIIYNAYLCAKYGITIKGISKEDLDQAKNFLDIVQKYPDKIIELPYIIESDTMKSKEKGKYRSIDIKKLKKGDSLNYVLDIAEESYSDQRVVEVIGKARSIFVNAVMGFTPNFNEGTVSLYSLIDKNKNANKMFGGGDTLQEFRGMLPGTYINAVDDPNYYFFSGGGTILKAIETGSITGLPPIKALIRNAKMMQF